MRQSNLDTIRAARMAVPLLIGGLLLLPAGAQAGYLFQDIVNPDDPAFNQELSINNTGVIAGYFGSGNPNGTPPPFTLTPNKGYTTSAPYTSFSGENFPGSFQTQVTGINNSGLTVGFYADSNGATTPNFFGFVDNAGTFTRVMNPSTPTTAPTTNQLLGMNKPARQPASMLTPPAIATATSITAEPPAIPMSRCRRRMTPPVSRPPASITPETSSGSS